MDLSHLRGNKVSSVTWCEKEAIIPPQLLGKAKVADSDGVGVPRIIHIQNVAGLQVPMNHLCTGDVRFLIHIQNCFTILEDKITKLRRKPSYWREKKNAAM